MGTKGQGKFFLQQRKEKVMSILSEFRFKIVYFFANLITHFLFVCFVLVALALSFSAISIIGAILGFWQLPDNGKPCPSSPCYFCLYCLLKAKLAA